MIFESTDAAFTLVGSVVAGWAKLELNALTGTIVAEFLGALIVHLQECGLDAEGIEVGEPFAVGGSQRMGRAIGEGFQVNVVRILSIEE